MKRGALRKMLAKYDKAKAKQEKDNRELAFVLVNGTEAKIDQVIKRQASEALEVLFKDLSKGW